MTTVTVPDSQEAVPDTTTLYYISYVLQRLQYSKNNEFVDMLVTQSERTFIAMIKNRNLLKQHIFKEIKTSINHEYTIDEFNREYIVRIKEIGQITIPRNEV